MHTRHYNIQIYLPNNGGLAYRLQGHLELSLRNLSLSELWIIISIKMGSC